MKKLSLICALIISLSSQAFAKTEGSYVGVEILKANTDVKTKKISGTNLDTYFNNSSDDSTIGFGINYKYAFNFNKFFVAPSVFLSYIGADAEIDNVQARYKQNIEINNLLGAKVDFGYDITDKFAVYVPVGFSIAGYKFATRNYIDNDNFVETETTGTASGFLYGAGLSFSPIENMAINFEYNRTNFSVETGGDVALAGTAILEADVDVDVMKIGISYKF